MAVMELCANPIIYISKHSINEESLSEGLRALKVGMHT